MKRVLHLWKKGLASLLTITTVLGGVGAQTLVANAVEEQELEIAVAAENIAASTVSRQDGQGIMDLTEEGDIDWLVLSSGGIKSRKKDVEPAINFRSLGAESEIGNAGDCAVAYIWSDGVTEFDQGNVAGVFSDRNRTDENEVGFELTVAASDSQRVLQFVSSTWEATAILEIKANDQVIYSENIPGGNRIYSVEIAENEAITVTAKTLDHGNEWGNVVLGGVALKAKEIPAQPVEPENPEDSENQQSSAIIYSVRQISGSEDLNLSTTGSADWYYCTGANYSERKRGDEIITVTTLPDSTLQEFYDSKVGYFWNDGTKDKAHERTTNGRVYLNRNVGNGKIPEDINVGYTIEVPASDEDRILVFVPGVWQGKGIITLEESDKTTVVESISAGGSAVQKMIYVAVEAGKTLKVTARLAEHYNADGNITVAGVALNNDKFRTIEEMFLVELIKQLKDFDFAAYDTAKANALKEALESAKAVLMNPDADAEAILNAYASLKDAYDNCIGSKLGGQFMFDSNSGLTSSFGWEGDVHAPIAYIDGSYKLRDRSGTMVTFGVRDISGKIKWYNKEGYLPCFVSEYSKDGMDIVVENFANKHEIGGNAFEVAYSRMSVTNTTDAEILLPQVSTTLVPLNDEARNATVVAPHETVVRDYAIGADRFFGNYNYPEEEAIASCGSFDDNYSEMKNYWNGRLAKLATIVSLPNPELINAYKAGFIYTLIIRDDVIRNGVPVKELHVGENGYDEMFDHDTIGIVSALLTIGDFTYAKEYLASLPAQLQYDDAKWKYSWPYAVYLTKTGDIAYIKEQFETIKGHTHRIESDRDMNAGGIMKQTWAIDSYDYWLIDNWSALAGLTTYKFLCTELYENTNDAKYLAEKEWAESLYADLSSCIEKKQADVRKNFNYPYLSIDMTKPTEKSARSDERDGNWASMFLFGRWAWDGYLFGANQENSEMISLIDATYQHGFDRRANNPDPNVGDTIYNFGGYPHGIYSSAYNAGYGSTALRGEAYREVGIRAYEFMIDKSMSGPFGWWEGVDWPSDTVWDVAHTRGGGGSCQHMWGQSTATKVLFDSLIAEKVGEKVIIGRGIPKEWNSNNQVVEIKDISVDFGKKTGYKMTSGADSITVEFSGDELSIPYSIELIAIKNNIASVVADGNRIKGGIDRAAGTVLIPAGTNKVVIKLGAEEKEEVVTPPTDPTEPTNPTEQTPTEQEKPSNNNTNNGPASVNPAPSNPAHSNPAPQSIVPANNQPAAVRPISQRASAPTKTANTNVANNVEEETEDSAETVEEEVVDNVEIVETADVSSNTVAIEDDQVAAASEESGINRVVKSPIFVCILVLMAVGACLFVLRKKFAN